MQQKYNEIQQCTIINKLAYNCNTQVRYEAHKSHSRQLKTQSKFDIPKLYLERNYIIGRKQTQSQSLVFSNTCS